MRRAIVAAILGALVAAPGHASDFSKLSEPTFARLLLLDPVRSREAQCATVALANARLGRAPFKESDALAMAGLVRARVAIEIGSANDADDLVVKRGDRWLPGEWDSADEKTNKRVLLDYLSGQCQPYYTAFANGGLEAFAAALKPQGPLIALLPVAECVAIAEASRTNELSPYQDRDLVELGAALDKTMNAAERSDHKKAVADARERLKAARLDPGTLGARAIACMATFRQRIATNDAND